MRQTTLAALLWVASSSLSSTHAFSSTVQHPGRPFSRHSRISCRASSQDDTENTSRSENDWDSKMWDPNSSTNSGPARPNKADVYSMEELESILNIHTSLTQSNTFFNTNEDAPASPLEMDLPSSSSSSLEGGVPSAMSELGGLHEMVLQALQEDDDVDDPPALSNNDNPLASKTYGSPSFQWTDDLKQRILNIRAIASDVDGTLLTADHQLHPITFQAIQKALDACASPVRSLQHFVLATGKSRSGALLSLGPEAAELLGSLPGAFVQGLYCVNATGHVIYEEKIQSHEMIAQAEDMVHAMGGKMSIIAYDGDTLYSTTQANPEHIRQVHDKWGEPKPVLLETTKNYANKFHKFLVMADTPEEIEEFRPKFQALADEYGAGLTESVPTMVELLPTPSSGKAAGVAKLCKHVLGIDMETQLLTMGDGENDLEFLQQAAVGVAMGNAVPVVKEAPKVDIVMSETSDEGAAGKAIELFGFGKALEDAQ